MEGDGRVMKKIILMWLAKIIEGKHCVKNNNTYKRIL